MPQWIFPGITLTNGIRIEFLSLSRASVLFPDLKALETDGYFFRAKGKTSVSTGAICTICFSRDFVFSGDNLSKIVANLYEEELKNIPEFMKIKGETERIKKYLLQVVDSIKVFLENEKLLSNKANGMGKRAK